MFLLSFPQKVDTIIRLLQPLKRAKRGWNHLELSGTIWNCRRLWNARRAILYCLLAGDIISVLLSSGKASGSGQSRRLYLERRRLSLLLGA